MRFNCGPLKDVSSIPVLHISWVSVHGNSIPIAWMSSRKLNAPRTSWGHHSSLCVFYTKTCLSFDFFLWNYKNIIGRVNLKHSTVYRIPSIKKNRVSISTLEKSVVLLALIPSSIKIKLFYWKFTMYLLCTRHWDRKMNQRNTFLLPGTFFLASPYPLSLCPFFHLAESSLSYKPLITGTVSLEILPWSTNLC